MSPTVLGIDPGTQSTGIALVAPDRVLTDHTIIAAAKTPMHQRIIDVQSALVGFIDHYKPNCIACEDFTFQGRYVNNLKAMGMLLGMILGMQTNAMRVEFIDPLKWKRSITGLRRGKIDKRAVLWAVEQRTRHTFDKLNRISADGLRGGHSSDAAGVALVHLDQMIMEGQRNA